MPTGNIVFIDDCPLHRRLGHDLLKEEGYNVQVAESALAANPFLMANPPPALIIIDIIMPLMTGDRKIELIKQSERLRDIPVILLSSRPEEELRAIVARTGAAGYLQKPLSRQALVSVARQFVP